MFGQGLNVKEHDMRKFQDLTGQKFGRLTVIKRIKNDKHNHIMYLCKCDCSNEKIVRSSHLKSGAVQSCGCYNIEKVIERSVIHYRSHTRLYWIWVDMKSRCYNPNDKRYNTYGLRGITICQEWKDNFKAFYDWACINGYDEKAKRGECMIDRIDNNKGYSPDNCKWSNAKEQANNTTKTIYIEYNGETHTLSEWSDIVNILRPTLWARLKVYKWSIKKTLTTPLKRRK